MNTYIPDLNRMIVCYYHGDVGFVAPFKKVIQDNDYSDDSTRMIWCWLEYEGEYLIGGGAAPDFCLMWSV